MKPYSVMYLLKKETNQKKINTCRSRDKRLLTVSVLVIHNA